MTGCILAAGIDARELRLEVRFLQRAPDLVQEALSARELFDALTLRQTGRMQQIPIIIFGREYWQHVIDFQYLADEGTVDDEDLELVRYAETAEEAWEMIREFHRR